MEKVYKEKQVKEKDSGDYVAQNSRLDDVLRCAYV